MYCWPKITGKRGSDEVVPCLHDFLSKLPSSVTSLRLYSDGCGGQNKNATVMHYLLSLVATVKFRHIRHLFPVTGHSHLPNDRDFGRTELNNRKKGCVYSPGQWMTIIQGARRRRPFRPVEGTQSMFLDYTHHFSIIFKKTIQNKKNIWTFRRPEFSIIQSTSNWRCGSGIQGLKKKNGVSSLYSRKVPMPVCHLPMTKSAMGFY